MNLLQFAHSLLLTSAVVALFTTRALSQEKVSSSVDLSKASTDSRSSTQFASLGTLAREVKAITEIRRLNQIKHLSQSARMLLVQSPTQQNTPSAQIVQVTHFDCYLSGLPKFDLKKILETDAIFKQLAIVHQETSDEINRQSNAC